MAASVKTVIQAIRISRTSLFSLNSSYSSFTPTIRIANPNTRVVHGIFNCLETSIRSLQSVRGNVSRLCNSCRIQGQGQFVHNFRLSGQHFSGWKLKPGCMFVASVAFREISFHPQVAYTMDGFDILANDHEEDSGASDMINRVKAFWEVARNYWLPCLLLFLVATSWNNPLILAAKVTLFLIGTRPSPLSVYVVVEKMCNQSHDEMLHFFQKPVYARKVEVDDYKLLCIARVELKDQKFNLIGIIGNWWVLPSSPDHTFRGALDIIRKQALKVSRDLKGLPKVRG